MAPKSRSAPNAIQLLKKDHAEVAELFSRFQEADDQDEKGDIATQVCRMLTIHAVCEEELLYPAAREAIDAELVHEAEVEHQSVKDLITRIEDADADDENFDAMVKVLGEYVGHHVREEEGELFAQLKRSDVDLDALGVELAERKLELQEAWSAEAGEQEDDDDEDDDEDFEDDDDDDENAVPGGDEDETDRDHVT